MGSFDRSAQVSIRLRIAVCRPRSSSAVGRISQASRLTCEPTPCGKVLQRRKPGLQLLSVRHRRGRARPARAAAESATGRACRAIRARCGGARPPGLPPSSAAPATVPPPARRAARPPAFSSAATACHCSSRRSSSAVRCSCRGAGDFAFARDLVDASQHHFQQRQAQRLCRLDIDVAPGAACSFTDSCQAAKLCAAYRRVVRDRARRACADCRPR